MSERASPEPLQRQEIGRRRKPADAAFFRNFTKWLAADEAPATNISRNKPSRRLESTFSADWTGWAMRRSVGILGSFKISTVFSVKGPLGGAILGYLNYHRSCSLTLSCQVGGAMMERARLQSDFSDFSDF